MATGRGECFYKDANRDWWKIIYRKGREEPAPDDPELVDQWWDYTLYRERDSTGRYLPVWSGSVFCLQGRQPTVEMFLRDFATAAVCLALGFTWSEVIRAEFCREGG